MAKAGNNAKRDVFNIWISPQAKKGIERILQKTAMTQIAMCSRLMTWFEAQPHDIQMHVTGGFPSLFTGDVRVKILGRMVAGQDIDVSQLKG